MQEDGDTASKHWETHLEFYEGQEPVGPETESQREGERSIFPGHPAIRVMRMNREMWIYTNKTTTSQVYFICTTQQNSLVSVDSKLLTLEFELSS